MTMIMATMLAVFTMKSVLIFSNKIMFLIIMELMFLLVICSQMMTSATNHSTAIFMSLAMMMVLDSTMGMSILMTSSRNSYASMQQFKNI